MKTGRVTIMTKTPLDRNIAPVVQSAPEGKVEAAPPRMIQEMLNHRRMLIGMLSYTEKTLIRYGVKITPKELNL
jgi:hypothetical protein